MQPKRENKNIQNNTHPELIREIQGYPVERKINQQNQIKPKQNPPPQEYHIQPQQYQKQPQVYQNQPSQYHNQSKAFQNQQTQYQKQQKTICSEYSKC